MDSKTIRDKFLKFFEKNDHVPVRSGPLIPVGDPTLYFTNAGMVPFKKTFTGEEKRDYSRATSSQKCLRVSGKHNDLENVGRTARHHTFFEMLGNFSFGDYFKKDAIRFAWEFLTQEMAIDPNRLWVSVYDDDDEAADLWVKEAKVSPDRILRFGADENFWSMGATGPCGPCSEIHYDHGPEHGEGPKDKVNGETDRFMEIWNLVFMQYNQDESGERTPLPKPSIDTGMGLERLAAVCQGVHSNYETDLFVPLLEQAATITKTNYGSGGESDVSLRVLSDHMRATAFLIADGVQPSNDGRGYVLRRIMRRAIRHGRKLGMDRPFFSELLPTLINVMGQAYPELEKNCSLIEQVIVHEEKGFLETIDKGLELIQAEFKKHQQDKVLPGTSIFTLYDTYGFPVDLTRTIAEEKGFTVDEAGFEKEMEAQRDRGRKAWKGSAAIKAGKSIDALTKKGLHTTFIGYDSLTADTPIAALIHDDQVVERAEMGQTIELVSVNTPFYAESGGQVGDHGIITTPNARLQVLDTQKGGDGLILHHALVEEGTIQEGDEATFSVDPIFREGSMLHHSATHLFHAALRKVLGDHVRQAGSLVTPERTRFDFSHFQPLTVDEIQAIEDLVNEQVRANLAVTTKVLPYDEAIAAGALAFFGDKYGDVVRMCQMGDFSTELCGGTHVTATGQIGLFKITGQSAVGSGTRRIEAVVGTEGVAYLRALENQLTTLAEKLGTTPKDLAKKLDKYLAQVGQLESEVESLKSKLMSGSSSASDEKVATINGVKVLTIQTEVSDKKLLRKLSDDLVKKVDSGVVVIGATEGNNVRLIIRVTKDKTDKHKAGDLIKQLAPIVGGRGGGRPDMAEAGGDDASKLPQVFEELQKLI